MTKWQCPHCQGPLNTTLVRPSKSLAKIASFIQKQGAVTTAELKAQFPYNSKQIHNHLNYLNRHSLIHRIRHGLYTWANAPLLRAVL